MDVYTRRNERRKAKRKKKEVLVVTMIVIIISATAIVITKYLDKKNNISKNSVIQGSNEDSKESVTEESDKKKDEIVKDENKSSTDNKDANTSDGDTETNNSTINSNQAAVNKSVGNLKEIFKRDVFLGDSISEGLSYYDVLNEVNVVAAKGINITRAKNEVDKMVKVNPENIFILFGVNDMSKTSTSEWFVKQYAELIHNIKAKLPNSHIYIQSIMPVLPKVQQKRSYVNSKRINEWNMALMELSKKENVGFVDIASVVNDSTKNLYEQDGIHFKAAFYPVWLSYVANSVK